MEPELKQLIDEAVRDTDLSGADLPAFDLYMDQIISLVAERNAEGSPRYADRTLTKTMINNYSKDGLIAPIHGKKYTREQILQMLCIYSLKNTLSIGEIKRVLYGIYHEVPGFDGEALGKCYDQFLEIKATNREESAKVLEDLVTRGGLDPQKPEDYFLAVLGMVSMAAYCKAIAEAMLEARYPDPDEAEKRLKEEEERIRKEEQREKSDKKKAKEPAEPEKETTK